MAVKESKSISVLKSERHVYSRCSEAARAYTNPRTVCKFWLAGRCNRNPCRFAHVPLQPSPNTYHRLPKQPGNPSSGVCPRKRSYDSGFSNEECHRKSAKFNGSVNSNYLPAENSTCNGLDNPVERLGKSYPSDKANDSRGGKQGKLKSPNHSSSQTVVSPSLEDKSIQKIYKLCKYWAVDNCVQGDSCHFIHSWLIGDDFSSLAKLEGHSKAISGIALPSGSDKLYSGSRDGTINAWDCHTGCCAQAVNVGAEVGSLISEGPWIFVGMPNVVKAWNSQISAQFDLKGPVGQVYAMVASYDMLFAGAQDGAVSVWKCSPEINPFQWIASLKGHCLPVLSLAVGRKSLYSGSSDHTIRIWDMETLQCFQILHGHSGAVMSLLCWDEYLLSCSLDQTIKMWKAAEGGSLEVTYTHSEEHGVLALHGMTDADAKPVLFRSCNDNTVCLYDLPSFMERGRIFSKQEVRAIQIGPGGLFFTGDGTGLVNVWKWSGEPRVGAS